ncbi:S9 family peptidase [uncultured Sphingomonas sp.]|uniref:S9 family peptidase n=2 Tax=uncultured Sphingomonas sp. TaxID=158754 RepID=UPI0025D94E09|nr:S9 family peptidase [uncultured Sphingomonas sp.]
MRTSRLFLAVLLCATALPATGQTPTPSTPLTVENVLGKDMPSVRWARDGKWTRDGTGFLKLEASKTIDGGQDIVRYDIISNARTVVVPAELLVVSKGTKPIDVQGYSFSPDERKLLIYTNSKTFRRTNAFGDYWLLDLNTKALRKLGGDAPASRLMYATFSPDGTQIAYVRSNNLYVEPTAGGAPRQLTTDGDTLIVNGIGDWVYEEEYGLAKAWSWSPDSKRIAFWRFDTSLVGTFNMITNTEGQYSRVIPLQYPKAGTVNSAATIGTIDLATGTTTWIPLEGDPRQNYVPQMSWTPDSRALFLQQSNRLQNAYKVILADPTTGKSRTLLTERDAAWVEANPDPTWMSDGRGFTWLSERDGWRHLYVGSRDGNAMDLRTPGDFDVIDVLNIDPKSNWVWFTAAPGDPTRRYLYRATLTGKKRVERVSPMGQVGTHDYDMAPAGRYARHIFSTFDTAPTTELVDMTTGRVIRTLATNQPVTDVIAARGLGKTEFTRLDIGGGTELDAWIIKPKGFDPSKTYPLFVHVYGEPWGQTVADRFGGRNDMWHRMLAERGYIVASIDPRGTAAPRGRAWRKSIYEQVGIQASADLAAGVRKLIATRSYVDPDRIGVWGWSGGGSMTLNAMFRYPDLYKTGIAVAAVSDMRLYDTVYQERYMGLPSGNAKGYRDGSPINFAQNLKGNLLMIHGTGDDNVHYQNLEQLLDKLIANNKTTFQMMAYPDRAHGIYEKPGTSLHLYTLMTRYLEEKLPPGPR